MHDRLIKVISCISQANNRTFNRKTYYEEESLLLFKCYPKGLRFPKGAGLSKGFGSEVCPLA